MEQEPHDEIPTHPKLRPVDPQWIDYQGQQMLLLRDPLGMAPDTVLIPQPLVPLAALCDGTRTVAELQSGLALRTGTQLPIDTIRGFISQLDAAFLIENGSFETAVSERLEEYRNAEHRTPSHAGLVYPEDKDGLVAAFQEYCSKVSTGNEQPTSNRRLVGIVCPHIDYMRGYATYAELWRQAEPYLDDVELAIILGTDHSGGLGMLTPTRQSYATPLGVMPTERSIVDGLADVLGHENAFSEEIHHLNEHSIELVAVWFHYFLNGRACPVVPILCGSFHSFVTEEKKPEEHDSINAALQYLREVTSSRKTLVIAAGDLAHVGPAFGDPEPLDTIALAKLTAEDNQSIAAICDGDGDAFLEHSRRDSDARRICGLSSIYMTLKLVDGAKGESMGYDQCPADADGGSVVSIAGVLLYEPS